MARRPAPTAATLPFTPVAEVLLGAACLASAYVIVFVARLGGVVATLTADRGIHSGDVAAVPVVLLGVALLFAGFRSQHPA